jgi:hypothetical protein
MTEQQLDGAHIGTLFQQVDGKGMAHGMWGNWFGNVGAATNSPASLFHRDSVDMASGNLARKEPMLGPLLSPPVAEDFQQLSGNLSVVELRCGFSRVSERMKGRGSEDQATVEAGVER